MSTKVDQLLVKAKSIDKMQVLPNQTDKDISNVEELFEISISLSSPKLKELIEIARVLKKYSQVALKDVVDMVSKIFLYT